MQVTARRQEEPRLLRAQVLDPIRPAKLRQGVRYPGLALHRSAWHLQRWAGWHKAKAKARQGKVRYTHTHTMGKVGKIAQSTPLRTHTHTHSDMHTHTHTQAHIPR